MQKKKSPSLIKIFLFKEGVFWKRTWSMRKKSGWLGFLIAIPFLTIAHYVFALMHFLFECFLWATIRAQFRANLRKLQSQMA
jgi:hypothetical protein